MLRSSRSLIRLRKRFASDDSIQVRSGGFHDPWFADSEYTKANYEMTKDFYQFPQYNGKLDHQFPDFIRPTKPEVWEEQTNRLGNRIRPFHRYVKEFHGYAPKPNWNITQRSTGARRGRIAGVGAKVVWKPPGKSQRQVMQDTGVLEMPPLEFMEEYTRVNETYKDEMTALREYLFYRFVEPTIVEEEAIAQIRVLLYKIQNQLVQEENKLEFIKNANSQIPVTETPMRHNGFINWWKYIGSKSVDEHGRGQKIVKAIMTQILEDMESIDELDLITKYNFDTIDRVKLDDLDQRLAFNTQRNESRKAASIEALEYAEEGHLERQAEEDEYFEMLRLAEDQARKEHWEKLVEESEHFIYPENVTSKVLESLEQPTTHNHPLKKDGFPGKPLVTTIEHKFRVAQLETDFIKRDRLINEGKITNPEEDAQFVHETHAEREEAANEQIMKDKEEEKVHRMTAYSSDKNE